MVTMVAEKRVIDSREADVEFDGRWLLLDMREFHPSDDMGYVVAYGNGTPEDREALEEINFSQYHGEALLMKGWVQKDEVFYSGILEEISTPL